MATTQAEQTGVTLVTNSQNAKLGQGVWATYVSQVTCPLSCPFRGNGCYAESGHMRFVSTRLNRAQVTPDEVIATEADKIRAVTYWGPGRIHVVGDATTDKQAAMLADAVAHYQKRWAGKALPKPPVWTYTHGHETRRESWGSISVLRSCENVSQVRKAFNDGFAAALVIVCESDKAFPHPEDNSITVVPCPQQTRPGVTCASCGLCARDELLRAKRIAIGFTPHGTAKRRVLEVLASQ